MDGPVTFSIEHPFDPVALRSVLEINEHALGIARELGSKETATNAVCRVIAKAERQAVNHLGHVPICLLDVRDVLREFEHANATPAWANVPKEDAAALTLLVLIEASTLGRRNADSTSVIFGLSEGEVERLTSLFRGTDSFLLAQGRFSRLRLRWQNDTDRWQALLRPMPSKLPPLGVRALYFSLRICTLPQAQRITSQRQRLL